MKSTTRLGGGWLRPLSRVSWRMPPNGRFKWQAAISSLQHSAGRNGTNGNTWYNAIKPGYKVYCVRACSNWGMLCTGRQAGSSTWPFSRYMYFSSCYFLLCEGLLATHNQVRSWTRCLDNSHCFIGHIQNKQPLAHVHVLNRDLHKGQVSQCTGYRV